jgi:hypothetical protein
VVAHRASEGTPDVSEELGLEQTLRQGAAVDRQERAVGGGGKGVNRLCQELLAGAAFAGDEYGRRSRRETRHHVQDAADSRARADEVGDILRFPLGRATPQQLFENQLEVVDVERFREVLCGACAKRLECMLWCCMGCDDDEGAFDLMLLSLRKDLETAAVGQLEVTHHEIEIALDDCFDTGSHRVGGGDLVTLLFKEDRQELAQRALVVDNQDVSAAHAASLCIGSSTVTVVPKPGALSIDTVPLCSATAA